MKLRCMSLLLGLAACVLQAEDGKALHDASTAIQRPGAEYGAELAGTALGIGPTMDVAIAGDLVFAIGKGELRVLSNARAGKPAVIGRLGGLGNTRQIAVARGHAFITSREDGMFVVDVREPAQPKLLHHYDTAELATAIAVSGDVAAVGNRFAGIELLDVSRPAEPKHLATIRVGEVQSLVFRGPWLYAGTWSEKAIAVVDVSNPWQPRLASTVPLNGNGDGLDVSGTLLAAATGHHARTKGAPKRGDAAFGNGHGVEFFDLADPAAPRRLSGLKFPPFYRIGMDMWGVVLAGGHAFVNDTHNGFFLVDVRDPAQPRAVGWKQLPPVKPTGDPSPAAGLAVANGRAFVAGGFDELHLVETGLAGADPQTEPDDRRVPPQPASGPGHGLPVYRVDGAVAAVMPWRDDRLLVAAGSAGLHVVRVKGDAFERLADYPTRGFARGVTFHGEHVYVAESMGGLSIWSARADGTLERVGGYDVPGKSIHQVVLADEGRVGFLAVGANTLHVVKFGPGAKVERLLEETPRSGLFYREPFSPVSPDGKRVLVQWHTIGLHEFLAENGTVKRTGWTFPHPMGTECGAVALDSGWVATSRSGFFFLSPGETRTADAIGLQRLDGRALPGKPSVHERTLFITDPFLGDVSAIDLREDTQPRMLGRLALTGHPGRVRVLTGKALIPAGRDGLLLWKVSTSTP